MSTVIDEPGSESILQALSTLYSNSSRSQKEAANEFLENFQKSSQAWQTTHDILQASSVSIESKLFAAQTLRMKFDFHQLPTDSLPDLRNSIVALIIRYCKDSRPILVALCVALAALALQMKEWKTVIQDMAGAFDKSAETWTCLLQFLAILPEEINETKRMSLSEEELSIRTSELLSDNSEVVLSLLLKYLQGIGSNQSPNPLVFTCLANWLKEIPVTSLANTPLIDITFHALNTDAVFEPAVDLLCSIFKETSEVNEPAIVNVIQYLFPRLMQLRPRIKESRNDPDAFRGYSRLFAEAGESWVILVARLPTQFRSLVETLLEAAAIDEDLEIVKFSFNFWYDLKQAITLPRYEEARAVYADIYAALVDIMISHLHYPFSDNEDDLFGGDRDAEDKFRSFRHEMGDVLKDCCNVVGGDRCLQKAFFKVQDLLSKQQTGEKVRWQEIEAPLFSMRAMAREISTEEGGILPQIMSTLLSLPEHPKVRYAATLVLGRYTEWTAQHSEYLSPQLNYITSGFERSSPEVTSAAAQALKHFCRDCSTLLAENIAQLYGFYENVLPSLDFESSVEVTEGIAHVVAALPLENLSMALKSFVGPIASRLVRNSQEFSDDIKLQRKIADDIELLTVFAFTVVPYVDHSSEHPCIKVFAEIWPVLSHVLDVFGQLPFICERICSFMKTMLNNYRHHMLCLLPAFAEKLAFGFDKYKYGCFLWVSGACVRQFASPEENAPETVEAVWHFVNSQCTGMFKLLTTTQAAQIPDGLTPQSLFATDRIVVEDFYRLLIDALLGNPERILTSTYLNTIIEAALASLQLEQSDALLSIIRFLRELLAWNLPSPPTSGQSVSAQAKHALDTTVKKYGAQLTATIFSGQIYFFPRDCVTDASAVILTLGELQPQSLVIWITETFDRLPAGSVGAEEKQKVVASLGSALAVGDFKRVRSQLQDWTTLYRRRMVTPRNKTSKLTGTAAFQYSGA